MLRRKPSLRSKWKKLFGGETTSAAVAGDSTTDPDGFIKAERIEADMKACTESERLSTPVQSPTDNQPVGDLTVRARCLIEFLIKFPLIGQYVIDPIVTVLQGTLQYIRSLIYSVLFVRRLHKLLGGMSGERAIKQSREFLLTSICLSAAIFAFVAFVPEDPIASRKEILHAWLNGMFKNARVALLFCSQAAVTWFFVRRCLRTNLSPMRFFALAAFFIGGPCLFLVTAANSLEFGIPSKLIVRLFPSLLVLEGLLGMCVTFLGFVLLCTYLWPLVRTPKWRSLLMAALLWHVVWLAVFAADVVVSRKPIVSDIKEMITAHQYCVTTATARRVALDAADAYATHVLQKNELPPPEMLDVSSPPVFDSWGKPIFCGQLQYMDESGVLHPYWLAISAGPNGKLDITGSDLEKLHEALATGRFANVEMVNQVVDLALAPFSPAPLISTNPDGTLLKRNAKESWEKVDIFGTAAIPHAQWLLVLQRIAGQGTNAMSR